MKWLPMLEFLANVLQLLLLVCKNIVYKGEKVPLRMFVELLCDGLDDEG